METAAIDFIKVFVSEGCAFLMDLANRSIDNYGKRRRTGFGIIRSISGSFYETRNYYSDLVAGNEPTIYVEAIIFDK